MNETTDELFGLVLKGADRQLLVPRSALCEVIGYSDPEPAGRVPEWLLGYVRWNGQAVPLVVFECLAGAATPAVGSRTRVAVLTGLAGRLSPPCIALLVQDHPQPVRLTADALEAGETPGIECVRATVLLNGEPHQVPDLAFIERAVAEVVK